MPVVLFVDDDPAVLRSLPRLFRGPGMTTLVAPSGAAALDVLATNDVDVVVSDHRMPGMIGTELLGLVASRYPRVRRILLTGDMGALTAETAAVAVAHVMLRKPSSPAELRAAITP